MASAWRRVMVYLGLVDDDEYEEYEPYDEPAAVAPPPPPPAPPRRSAISYVEPEGATAGVRTLPREPESNVSVQPRPAPLRPVPAVQTARPYVVAPDGFNDAQQIGDKLKANQPVIVNLQAVDRDLARRLIDFASGLAYGLGGQMERVADQVFMLTPTNVEVSAEEKRRLQERGLYRS
ncbi:MAG: cell division protein SepF [Acidimicrobiia bacterium]|nr:cell division protein SepF [Acidimicrobiia bacterium]